MAPLTSFLHPGTLVYFLVFLLIGMGFGAILEMAGFGDSRKLSPGRVVDSTKQLVIKGAVIFGGGEVKSY